MRSPHDLSRTAILFVAVLSLGACVGTSQALRDGAADHVYSQPLAELWPQVEASITEQGYTFRRAPGQYVLRTEWRENGTSGSNRTLVSYLVQGEPQASGGSILRVSRGLKADPNDQTLNPSSEPIPGANTTLETWDRLSQQETAMQSQRAIFAPTRDVDMELALMRKLDPAAVAKLEGKGASASR